MSFRNWKYLFTEAKSIELELPVSFKSYFFAKNIMSLVVRKPIFEVFDLVPHKPCCTTTQDGQRHEISDLGSRGIVTIYVAKTKALISFAVTVKLICVFVFAYAKSRFSHNEALMMHTNQHSICFAPRCSSMFVFYMVIC